MNAELTEYGVNYLIGVLEELGPTAHQILEKIQLLEEEQ